MRDLESIARLRDVTGAVRGDRSGGFHDAVREPEGETVAAVMAFVSTAFGSAGERLGLGALRRVSVAGEARGCVVVVDDEAVITASVAPGRSLASVEKALDESTDGKV